MYQHVFFADYHVDDLYRTDVHQQKCFFEPITIMKTMVDAHPRKLESITFCIRSYQFSMNLQKNVNQIRYFHECFTLPTSSYYTYFYENNFRKIIFDF